MSYSATEIELAIDHLFAASHNIEDAGHLSAARHMRIAADILQSVLDAREWKNTRVEDWNYGDECA
jgi:hypothetical protein